MTRQIRLRIKDKELNLKWARDLNRHFNKDDYKWQLRAWKDAQHHRSSGKCKLKAQETKIQKTDNTKCWWGCGTLESHIHCSQEWKMEYTGWKSLTKS